MPRGKRQRLSAATDASLLLVQEALLRAMAYLAKDMFASEGDGGGQIDYQERIRLIADVCENLPGYLRASSRGTSLEGLQYSWDNGDRFQRAWLQQTLALHGVTITEIIASHGGSLVKD